MENEYSIRVKDVHKSFKVYYDRSYSLKETLLFKNRRRFEERQVLKGISFDVKKGEAIGLVGHNGCGKSTMLKLLTRIMYPDRGSIEIKGRVSSLIELGAGFDGNLTARENIYLNGAILGYSKEFLDDKFDEIVEFSELKDFLDVPVKNFSSGMTAKLAFSIATIVNPEILIVDEILSVGDIKFQEKSKKKMMEMIKGGTTVLYVSHSLQSIKELCTKVVWLEHGKVVKMGDTNKICDAYYKEQMK